jgi:pimeloyl-ACP methyl ester carboxylesterase
MPEPLHVLRPSAPRRAFGLVVQGALGLILVYLAAAHPPEAPGWRLFLIALGVAALVLALTQPRRVRRLVVVDIAPVAYAHSQSHLIAAMRGVDLSTVTRRSEAAAQLDAVPDDGTRAFLLQSLDVAERRWMLNLDALDREMSKIVGFPEVEGRFDGPALFLSGGASDYVRPGHRERILSLFPEARFETIEGAGHWLHAERPRETEAAVAAFLDG